MVYSVATVVTDSLPSSEPLLIHKSASDGASFSTLSSLLSGMRRHTAEGITSSRIDSLLTLTERLLRIFTILLAVLAVSGGAEAQVMANNVRLMQEVVNSLDGILHVLNDESEHGYHAPVQFSGGRGRPKIVLTREMLQYFFDHGFSASTTAQLLQVSLRTVRRKMSDFGMLIRNQYSDITDHDLDAMVGQFNVNTHIAVIG